jgi:hypothetical protein
LITKAHLKAAAPVFLAGLDVAANAVLAAFLALCKLGLEVGLAGSQDLAIQHGPEGIQGFSLV